MRAATQVIWLGLAALVAATGAHAEGPVCPRADALGVSRTVEIDTTGGPGFGMEHYKAYDFLQLKEVVLTFDDGPQKYSTEMVLAALADQCTKATFFSIGKMALGYPEIIREVAKAGHTIGTHTWSHQTIAKLKTFEEGRDEIERGVSAVKRAVGGPIAPFFRYPTLVDTPESIAYLGKRNIAMFSTDIDSFDFKLQPAEHLVKGVMEKLEKRGKGIILMHDIHKTTAKALPLLLSSLKAKGYKVVHLKAKGRVATVAEYDAAIEKDAKGLPQAGTERATSSVVRTIEGDAPPADTAEKEAEPAKQAATTPAPAAPVETNKHDVTTATPEKPVAAPVAETAPAPVANPVTTKAEAPATTSSIAQAPAGEPAAAKADGAPPAATEAPKTLSEKAMAIWQLWFGK